MCDTSCLKRQLPYFKILALPSMEAQIFDFKLNCWRKFSRALFLCNCSGMHAALVVQNNSQICICMPDESSCRLCGESFFKRIRALQETRKAMMAAAIAIYPLNKVQMETLVGLHGKCGLH